MQEQQDGKKRAPFGNRPLSADEYVTDDQLASRTQTALEFTQKGLIFGDAVGVENVREKYAIESLRQRIAREIRADDLHSLAIAASPTARRAKGSTRG